MTLLGGAPGAGKTAFAMQLLIDALRLTPTVRALVCDVEMGPAVLLDRQLARLSGIDLTAIRHRRLGAEHADRIDRAMHTLEPLAERLAFVRPPFDLANVAATADAFNAQLLLLDYIQRIPPPGEHANLGAEDLEAALGRWIAPLVQPQAEQLRPTPMDGKTLRGSRGSLRAAVHLLSLLDGPTGGVLRQAAVDAKTNEHKTAPDLLEGLVLEGRLVTADAMFCHRDVAEQILERGGHYFFAVKDNQETPLKDVQAAFGPAFSPL